MSHKVPEVGEVYWCICPADEAWWATGDVVPPWRGKISRRYGAPDAARPAFALSRFREGTGEPDADANATTSLYPEQLHADELSAWRAYGGRMGARAVEASREYARAVARCIELAAQAPPAGAEGEKADGR